MSGLTVVKYLPDYASRPDETGIPLQKVGIRLLKVYRTWRGTQTLTRQSAYVNLIGRKGIHMSRLVRVLLSWTGKRIDMHDELLEQIASTHGDVAYWKCRWQDIIELDGPRFTVDLTLEGRYNAGKSSWYLTISMPYASVCPCSLEMLTASGSDGVPHMQRSRLYLTVRVRKTNESLERLVMDAVLSLNHRLVLTPWAVMTRAQELQWCVRAKRHPMFVEDVARSVAQMVREWKWIDDWVIVAEHEESIHEHNVVAVVWKGDELR